MPCVSCAKPGSRWTALCKPARAGARGRTHSESWWRPETQRKTRHVTRRRGTERAKYGYLLQLAQDQIQALESDDLFAFDRILAAKRALIEGLVDARSLVSADPVLRKQAPQIQELDETAQRLLYRKVGRIMREMAELQQFKRPARVRLMSPPGAAPRPWRASRPRPRLQFSGPAFLEYGPLPAGERVFPCRERTHGYENSKRSRRPPENLRHGWGSARRWWRPTWSSNTRRRGRTPFSFLRGTFYRWAQVWPQACEPLMDAPTSWQSATCTSRTSGDMARTDGRLVWGVNDFDEAYSMPYTNDLVRLATSALLAAHRSQLSLKPEDACAAILAGMATAWRRGGVPSCWRKSRLAARDGPREAP